MTPAASSPYWNIPIACATLAEHTAFAAQNRQWSDPEEVKAQLLRAGYPADQFQEVKLKPVGEIEKALGKKAFQALVGGLVSQGEGKLTLVPADDKRVEFASADADFQDLLN